MAEYVCPIEGPFDAHADAAAARTRIAKTPEYYSVAVFKGREKPKLDLEKDKYYVCGFRKEPLVPPPAPPVEPPVPEAKKEDFVRAATAVYSCRGVSKFLNRFCKETGADWKLRVNMRRVLEIEGPFDVRPLDRTYDMVTLDWGRGKEVVRRQHEPTKKWYWVTYPAELKETRVIPPPPPLPTPMRQAYIDFFKNPDIITAIGLTLPTIQDSFTKVFSGYSIIDDRPAEPEPEDYASVLLIIGGVTIAAATTVYVGLAAMPAIGTTGVMKGMVGVSGIGAKEVIKKLGITVGAKALGKYALKITMSPFFKIITVAGIWGILLWNFTDPMWWREVFIKMSGDFKRRFEKLRIDVETKLKQSFNLLHYDPTAATRAEALSLLRTTGPLITELLKMLAGPEIDKPIKELYPEFEVQVKAFVTQYNNLIKEAGGVEDDYLVFEELRIPEPVIAPTFPKEFLIEDAQVEDGDTLIWPGHPEAADRIRIIGIDAHESETAAGIEETAYLKSLIEHHQVKILTHQYHTPEMVLDIYGRLLGGVFLGDQDIALAMLEHFGESILTAKKYWKKYRWIDWDLYEKTAKAAVGPAVKEFKISIDSIPSNAKLFIDDSYTGHLTPSNEKELSDVMHLLVPGEHVFKATKGGKEGSVKATITDGANPAIMITLGVAGLELAPPEEVPAPPIEVPEVPVEEFSINIDSMPSNAKLFIDDIYTNHWTPSNERELRDVMNLLVPGKHTIKVTKAGKAASMEVEILPGFNEPIFLTLGVVGLAPPEVPPEIPPEVPPPEAPPEVPPVEKIDLRLPTPPGATELEGTPWADINHPDIKELAGTLKKETDAETVKVILEWIWENITKQPDTWLGTWPGEWRAASQILTYRKGDCSEHSLMVATLCRALGIPAVIYTGKISDLKGANAGGHCWNYVWIDGEWVMVEATALDGGMGKSYRYYPVGIVINPYIAAPILVDIPYFTFEDRPTKDWTEVEFAEAELAALK